MSSRLVRVVPLLLTALIGVTCQTVSPGPTARTLVGVIPGPSGRLGSNYAIRVPPAWNGTLFLYSHGTILTRPGERLLLGSPDVALDTGSGRWLFDHHFALAADAYAVPTGWAVQDALPDQIALLDLFQQRIARPKRVIAWGESQGGLDTALLLERNRGRFAGGLSICGLLGGGVSYFNHDLDMFFTLDRLLAPGTLIHANAPTLAGVDSTDAESLISAAQASAQGQARLALTAAIQDFPVRFAPGETAPAPGDRLAEEAGQMNWIRFALGTFFRQDVEQKAGGNPSGNAGVDYAQLLKSSPYVSEVETLYQSAGLSLQADLERLAQAPRINADPAAVQFMTQFGEPSGDLTAPLLTMHTIDDGRVIPGNERAYADLVGGRGKARLLKQAFVDRAGHCAFSDAEIIGAVQTLLSRIDTGRWPDTSPAAMNARAARVGDAYKRSAPLTYTITDSGQFVDYTPIPLPR